MKLLLETEPRVPILFSRGGGGGGGGGFSPTRSSPRSGPATSTTTGTVTNSRSFHMADDTFVLLPPPRSPMRNSHPGNGNGNGGLLHLVDLSTPPSSPSYSHSSPRLSSPRSSFGVVPLARFVIELVDELIQPISYGGLGGPNNLFQLIPIAEFLKILSNVYQNNKIESMAAMDAILEYTCQCRHEEMLMVVSLLSSSDGDGHGGGGGHGGTTNVRAPADDLEKFIMSKIKETAEYWKNVEIVTKRVQQWYRNCKGWMVVVEELEGEEEEEELLQVEDASYE